MIYLTGDTHGVLGSRRLTADRFPPGRTPTEEDMVIVTPPSVESLGSQGTPQVRRSPWYLSLIQMGRR